MAVPAYPYSFSSGDELDAVKFNENFNQLIIGMTNSEDDIAVASVEASVSLIVNSDLVCGSFIVGTLDAQTATFPVSCFVDGQALINGIFAVSGSTVLTLDTDEVSGGTLSVDQSNVRVIFPSLACGDIDYITTTNFEDGDILTIVNSYTEGGGEISSRIINSDVNIKCGSDTAFNLEDTITFIYNGVDDTFDLLFSADSAQGFFP